MRKNVVRLFALTLALTMVISLSACKQDTPAPSNQGNIPQAQKPAETEPVQSEPMVRLYFPTESFGNTSSGHYEYEENWWDKDEFVRKFYSIDAQGNETINTYRLNTMGEICGDDASVVRYERGLVMSIYTEYEENQFDILSGLSVKEYDSFGRLIKEADETIYKNGETEHLHATEYKYSDTEDGSIAIYGEDEDNCVEIYYDRNYRLTERISILWGKVFSRTVYEYNSAGCQTKTEVTDKDGNVTWVKTVYDYIEVPLSVAQKWPMFKWEYVE